MVKSQDWRMVVSEFELQSRCYVYFRTNTIGKGMKPPYPPSRCLSSVATVLLQGCLWHEITYQGWYAIIQKKTTKKQQPSITSLVLFVVVFWVWHFVWHLMVKLYCWSLGEYKVPLHCHNSQVHSELKWLYLLESYSWVKYSGLTI